jgi:ABC-type multidrug transport system fused ATPase/permease subunit
VQESFALLTEEVREALSGIRTITLHAHEADCAAKLDVTNRVTLARGLALVRLDALYDPVIALLAGSAMILALRFGGSAVLAGDMSLGQHGRLPCVPGHDDLADDGDRLVRESVDTRHCLDGSYPSWSSTPDR